MGGLSLPYIPLRAHPVLLCQLLVGCEDYFMRSSVHIPSANPIIKSVNKIETKAAMVKVIMLFEIDICHACSISYKERN
jgi:hypothetical protein